MATSGELKVRIDVARFAADLKRIAESVARLQTALSQASAALARGEVLCEDSHGAAEGPCPSCRAEL